ncbi:hypothetical protein EDB89DRAFT_1911212 [Lactarius sanguifluus]|nr:hypothetical protein EDB89DRAFT_1911212 [Lactarius sanguifluus]
MIERAGQKYGVPQIDYSDEACAHGHGDDDYMKGGTFVITVRSLFERPVDGNPKFREKRHKTPSGIVSAAASSRTTQRQRSQRRTHLVRSSHVAFRVVLERSKSTLAIASFLAYAARYSLIVVIMACRSRSSSRTPKRASVGSSPDGWGPCLTNFELMRLSLWSSGDRLTDAVVGLQAGVM